MLARRIHAGKRPAPAVVKNRTVFLLLKGSSSRLSGSSVLFFSASSLLHLFLNGEEVLCLCHPAMHRSFSFFSYCLPLALPRNVLPFYSNWPLLFLLSEKWSDKDLLRQRSLELSHPNACRDLGYRSALFTSKRGLKTLDVREYRPLSYPMEFRFYQRYTSHPNRQSGIQFLTHYNTHQRFRVNKDYIDYLHWGKEQGQARLPHRHQRVAFDFFDTLPPTRAEGEGGGQEDQHRWFSSHDPLMSVRLRIDSTFDPYRKVFSNPEHWNLMFSKRRPGEGDIRLNAIDSHSLLGPLVTQTDTQDTSYFQTETRGPTHGRVPGLNAPFLGEMDQQMMQAMSFPLNKHHTLTTKEGRFSKIIYLNDPMRNQTLSGELARELNTELDKATNAVYSKLTVLEAAQSGETDYFCGGIDMERLGFDMKMAQYLREQAAALKKTMITEPQKKEWTTNSTTEEKSISSGFMNDMRLTFDGQTSEQDAIVSFNKGVEAKAAILERDATRYEDRADFTIREHAALILRVQAAPRALMTLVNGKCRGTGCGIAIVAKYCGLKDISEFVFDGPHMGLTPYGGLTRWLSRQETSLKYPGLAEFVLLTGTSLFAGDALRLGWTDLFTSLPDMGYHIQDWFDTSEHMHNDAIAWQLGHLLETCFKMKEAHSSEMERCALTPIRARWIEDAFADQPDIPSLMKTLSEMETLPLSDSNNTKDDCRMIPFTLPSVEEGLRVLEKGRLRYTLAPFDVSPPEDPIQVRQAGEIFTSYVLERRAGVDVSIHRDREKVRRWHRQREQEYHAYKDMLSAPHPRHVYARLEGCENLLVDFDFVFDMSEKSVSEIEEGECTNTLNKLREAILKAFQMPANREIEIGWYLSTLDSCPVYNDHQLLQILHSDPGIEDPREKLKYPPLYFMVKRCQLYMSEWAYAVKHQLLLSCPYALHATWALLQEVRGEGTTEAVLSLSDTLATEYKYIARMIRRADFYQVGQYTVLSAEQWESMKRDREVNLHKSVSPLRPLPEWNDVFEKQVELDGHYFSFRPRWSPRTLEELYSTMGEGSECTEPLSHISRPIEFAKEGIAPLYPSLYCQKADRLEGMIQDAGGYEIVPGLGEKRMMEKEGGGMTLEYVVPPLQSNAYVPKNVNFYEMARHPWEDTPSSWRQDGYTEGSKAYFEQQYKAAERELCGGGDRREGDWNSNGGTTSRYWPSKEAVENTGAGEAEGEKLLQERLWGEFKRAERGVEGWATDLRKNATEGKLNYKLEIATQQEKIYDDEYYRWFIQPGQHPNPSGLLLGRRTSDTTSTDRELDSFVEKLMSEASMGSSSNADPDCEVSLASDGASPLMAEEDEFPNADSSMPDEGLSSEMIEEGTPPEEDG